MTHPPLDITFDPSPALVGSEWRVIAKHSNGEEQYIAGFADEAEAWSWLRGEARGKWLLARGYFEHPNSDDKPTGSVNYTEGDMHGTTEVDPTTQQRPLASTLPTDRNQGCKNGSKQRHSVAARTELPIQCNLCNVCEFFGTKRLLLTWLPAGLER